VDAAEAGAAGFDVGDFCVLIEYVLVNSGAVVVVWRVLSVAQL
jgi:hypothetical protein